MGQKLAMIYSSIRNDGGARAQMRLAMITGLTSQKAAEMPDAPEWLEKCKVSYKNITAKDCPFG